MSGTFVYTGRGWHGLDEIEYAEANSDGTHQLLADGKIVDSKNVDFLSTISQVIPEMRNLECLVCSEGDDEHPEDEILAEPVLAWGWTVQGRLVPITPSAPEGIKHEEQYGLRLKGESRVFNSSIGGFANEEEWLSAVLGRKPKLKAV